MTMDRSDRDLRPLTISIGGFMGLPVEDLRIRQAVDLTLVIVLCY